MQDQHADDSRVPQKKWWKEILGGNHIAKRLLLGLAFLVILTCFLHFRELRMEVLEIGTKAPRYVISQTDFFFWDEEATQTLKTEAVRDIGFIFKIDEAQVHAFRRAEENALIEQQKWRKALPSATFEDIYTLLDRIEDELLQERFADERTLAKMRGLRFSTDHFFLTHFPAPQPPPTLLPKTVWTDIQNTLDESKKYQPETIDYLLESFAKNNWKVQEDFAFERSIRQEVQRDVPDRYTHVEAGSQIIKRGDMVTKRHIAMVQAMKNALSRSHDPWAPIPILGSALIALSIMGVSLLYLHHYHREMVRSLQKMVLFGSIIAISMILAKSTEALLLYEDKNWIEIIRFPLIIPFAALLLCVLLDAQIAMVTSLFLVLLFWAVLAPDYTPFILSNFFAAAMTIHFARKLHKRKEVFAVCFKVWLSAIPLVVAFNWVENAFWSFNIATDLATTFAFMAGTALLSIGLLPIFEAVFHVMTDMTLMEYMDPDHELLRRLSLEAPGTYQHCLVVGNLSEAAARAIGANGLFCRVSSLYHDIGKLFNPHYFTENQLGGFNIHQLLTPTESTHVIIAHVAEGEALARKHHLPQSFIDIIREHHGTTMVYYFYCKQVEQMCGDATKVSEKQFRYAGPKPRTKESAIIMIADTVEATSRSLDEATEVQVADMVDKLVAEKAEDGQFDECQLTFEELGHVKKAIVKALMVTRHLRVKYPEKNENKVLLSYLNAFRPARK